MKPDAARETRIRGLHQKALHKKYTLNGIFNYAKLVADAKAIGVTLQTAISYSDAVVERLKKGGNLH